MSPSLLDFRTQSLQVLGSQSQLAASFNPADQFASAYGFTVYTCTRTYFEASIPVPSLAHCSVHPVEHVLLTER